MTENLEIRPLHKNFNLLKNCCQLINSEWPRSETARLRSLESSNANLPTSLVLLRNNNVIGHCKLSRLPTLTNACFIETVVISKELRGFGLGTYLMKETEQYCKDLLHFDTIYLSTKGQEKFYAKLGYEVCQPISIYGSPIGITPIEDITRKPTINVKSGDGDFLCPPPPPLPDNAPVIKSYGDMVKKTYMKKTIR